MPLKIQSPGELLAGQQQAITQAAIDLTIGVVNGKPPTIKSALVTAALERYGNALAGIIEEAIRTQVAGYEMIEGERWENDPATWDAGLEAAVSADLDEIASAIGAPFGGVIVGAALFNDAHAVALVLAQEYAKSKKPAGPHMGKFLSAIGIVDADIKAAENEAATQAKLYGEQHAATDQQPVGYSTSILADPSPAGVPPPPPAPPAVALGLVPPPPAPPAVGFVPPPPPTVNSLATGAPPPYTQASPPPPAPLPQPDAAALRHAWKLWYKAGTPDLDAFAKALGMSTGTLRNRCTSRTEGKVTAAQAQIIVADIDGTISDLTDARAVFAAIKG